MLISSWHRAITPSGPLLQWFTNYSRQLNHLRYRFPVPNLRESDLVDLGSDLGICTFNKLLGWCGADSLWCARPAHWETQPQCLGLRYSKVFRVVCHLSGKSWSSLLLSFTEYLITHVMLFNLHNQSVRPILMTWCRWSKCTIERLNNLPMVV